MQIKFICGFLNFFLLVCLSACAVGPDYVRHAVKVPANYKEAVNHAPKGWKVARPNAACDRGYWWKVFHSDELNALETKLNISNQNIALAAAQYQQALAIVDQARASYFPTITAAATITRQKQNNSGGNVGVGVVTPGSTGVIVSSNSENPFNSHSLVLNASWEPDIWGGVRRSVEASIAGAQASEAQLDLARLSAQASLVQYYFEMRGLDADQKLLNNTVYDYQKALKLTQNRYKAGVAGRADVLQAQSQLESAQALALNNHITRAQYEHAIAVLIGEPPDLLSLETRSLYNIAPIVPLSAPSELLERRPDIATAERQMAQANAQVGVAIAAYFPSLTLTSVGSSQAKGLSPWFSLPGLGWSLSAQLFETVFDGGLRSATTAAAKANYKASIANYRQTVLSAFQEVEDNLVALRMLKKEYSVQTKAANDAQQALKIVLNEYKAGMVGYSDVITAQIAAFNATKNASDVNYLQMTAAVGLIKALGGSWIT